MTHTYTKGQGQRSFSSKVRVETNGQTSGQKQRKAVGNDTATKLHESYSIP